MFKIDPKLGEYKPQFGGKLRLDFFVPISLCMDFLYKSGANFEFLAKTGLVSDLFLKVFLYILRFSEISFGLQFGTKNLAFFYRNFFIFRISNF